MESKTKVADDYCSARQDNYLKITKLETPSDGRQYFYIQFEVEFLHPSAIPVEDDEYLLVCPELECATSFQHFWVPCRRLKHDNLSWDEISQMLSKLGVPLHKQPFMLKRIAASADEIANAYRNKNEKVLPMRVSISVGVDYYSYDQEDETTIPVKESAEVSKFMPVPASKASKTSVEALAKEKVKRNQFK